MGSAPMGSARKRAFVKNVTFRVQTAPFDKITTDFWRSRRRLYIPDLLKAKKSGVRSTFFQGVSVFIKSVTFRVQTAPFDKITIDFCRSRRRLHDSDLPGAKKHKIGPKLNNHIFYVVFLPTPSVSTPLVDPSLKGPGLFSPKTLIFDKKT